MLLLKNTHGVKESEAWGDGNLTHQDKTQWAFLMSSRSSV